ncbi:DNA adenine methylase [Natroniella sp. ANB-PHB2]|uniref:DNA adenine methylase n=1 Tax=Natroniella sp. ANB-PHB2 TaxID=3384444 RepID=UPI0038D3931F
MKSLYYDKIGDCRINNSGGYNIMRYIGSKEGLLPFIDEVLEKNSIERGTFVDLFSGTGVVGKHFKEKGFKVISNDNLFFSYILQFVSIEMNTYPKFEGLELKKEVSFERCREVIDLLNLLEGEKGFFYHNYSPAGQSNRMYFTKENASKIDSVREKIEIWYKQKKIKKKEYYYLIYSLIQAIPYVSNTTGVYGAYLKSWDPRAKKDLTLEVPKITEGSKECVSYNRDANELIRNIKCDVLYLDPPYNNRQYASNYHILETAAKWDNPDIYGKTGLRPYDDQKSLYCYKSKALDVFKDLVEKARAKYIVLSYNIEGIMDKEDIIDILLTISTNEKIKAYGEDYRRYRSDSNTKRNYKQCNDMVKENIFFCEVK